MMTWILKLFQQQLQLMDKQSKLQYQQKVEKYLSDNHVYDLFEQLLKNIVIKQPEDPISYMIDKLSEPPTKKVFLVGPPGFRVRELALQIADHFKLTAVSIGDLLRKEVSKKQQLGEEIESQFKKFGLVNDDIVVQIVKKEIEILQKEKKGFIIEGFPKTRVQALAMQRAGIIPDTFIILNLSEKKLEQSCEEKYKASERMFDKHSEAEKKSFIHNHILEYSLGLSQVKELYQGNYFEVDCSRTREETVEEMAQLLRFKIRPKRPSRSSSILICGPPGSGRSSLGRLLSKKYGFIYISSELLLSDQIAKKTEVGKLAISYIDKGQLIPDNIMNGLINDRVSQVDCHLQGFVIEGYPKTDVQLDSLSSLKINPTLIVVIECDQKTSIDRLENRRTDPETGIIYESMGHITDRNIQARVVQQANDLREVVTQRYKRWNDLLKGLQKKFTSLIVKVSSTDPVKKMLENISFHLENN